MCPLERFSYYDDPSAKRRDAPTRWDSVHVNFSSFLWAIGRSIARIMQGRNSQPKLRLLLMYLRLCAKYLVVVRMLGRKIVVENVMGFTVHFGDYPSLLLLFQEIFIREDYYFSSKSAEPLVIDCGSNIGMGVFYFKTLYPRAKIIAFEANPVTFDILKKNLEINGLADIQILNKAVSDRDGTLNVFDAPDFPGDVGSSVLRRNGHPRVLTVDAVPLSRYVHIPVDFLKMDIEGSENAVMGELDHRNKLALIREMVIEYHHSSPECEDLAGFLGSLERQGLGYQIRVSTRFEQKVEQAMLIYAY